MKLLLSFLIIVITAFISFFFTDLESDSVFFSLVLPFVDFIILIVAALWLVFLFHKFGINQTSTPGDTSDSTDAWW